ncbi:MAG: cache domain-containing protein, partial [Planktothrix sp.]
MIIFIKNITNYLIMTSDRISKHKKTRQIPLRLLLIVPFVLQIVGTVGLVGFLSYRSGQKAVEEIAKSLITEVGDRIDQNLNSYLQKPKEVTRNNVAALKLGILNYQDFSAIERYFWEQLHIFDKLNALVIATETKDMIVINKLDDGSRVVRIRTKSNNYKWKNYLTDDQGNYTSLIQDSQNNDPPQKSPPENRPWYEVGKKTPSGTWQIVVSRIKLDDPRLVAAYVLPFFDRNNTLQGVASSSISLFQLGDFLKGLKIGKTGQAFILEKNGLLIGTSADETPFIPSLVNSLKSDKEKDDPNKYRLKAVNSQEEMTRNTTKKLLEYFGGLEQIKTKQELSFTDNGKRYFVQVVPFQG